MYRGIHPVLSDESTLHISDLAEKAKSLGFISPGDKLVVVAAEANNEDLSNAFGMHIVTAK